VEINITSQAVNLKRKFVFLGCGAVAKPVIYFLDKFIEYNPENVYIVDMFDMKHVACLQELFKKGANFMKLKLEDDDYEKLFSLLKLQKYDVVVDLTTDINCFRLIGACKKNSLLYINTSLEINWHFEEGASLYDQSLFKRHELIDALQQEIKDPNNATHVYEFGMNPGLISIFTQQGIEDVALRVLKEREDKELQLYVAEKDYKRMAYHMGLEVVHISEVDT